MTGSQAPDDADLLLPGLPNATHPAPGQACVVIVDDDPHIRLTLSELLGRRGYQAICHASGESLLGHGVPTNTHCLLLDLSLPGAFDGIQLLGILRSRRVSAPALFLSGAGDVRSAVRALHAGAADFIEKPFKSDDLLAAIAQCVAVSRGGRGVDALKARFASLSPRELAVMQGVVDGLISKEIADRLGISPRTVEIHRLNMMGKLQARNIADLVRIAFLLQPQLLDSSMMEKPLTLGLPHETEGRAV